MLKLTRRLTPKLGLGLLIATAIAAPALASTYGSGNYGNCPYSTGCAQSSSSSDSSSSGSSTTATPPSGSNVLLNDYPEYSGDSGKTLDVSVGQVIDFKVGDEQHTITIKSIDGDQVAVIILRSTPIEVTFRIGQTQSFDVNGDGKDDIQITLNSISGGNANFTFKSLSQSSSSPTAPTTTPTQSEAGHDWTLWGSITLIVLALIGAIWLWLWRRRRKRHDQMPTTTPPNVTPPAPPAPPS